MEKLPTIILPKGRPPPVDYATFTGPLETPSEPPKHALFRLGGIRLRCSHPQQSVEDFYAKRLGMQELVLDSSELSTTTSSSATKPLAFRLVLPPKPYAVQLVNQASLRLQKRGSSIHVGILSGVQELSTPAAEALAQAEGLGNEEAHSSKRGSRHHSVCSSFSTASSGPFRRSASTYGPANYRLAAYDFFPPADVETALLEAAASGESVATLSQFHESWWHRSFKQFILEFVPVSRQQRRYKPYKHDPKDTFSRISICVSNVDAAARDLVQHMVRVEPAGQFLDLAYAAGFFDPDNFRGRLLQHQCEYEKVAERGWAGSSDPHPSSRSFANFSEDSRPDESNTSEKSTTAAPPAGCLPPPHVEPKAFGEESDEIQRFPSVKLGTLPPDSSPMLHHLEIRAADANKMLRFYEEVIGMTLIEKKLVLDFGFCLYFLAFQRPTRPTGRYWLWVQHFSCICIKAWTNDQGSLIKEYKDVEPTACGFLGFSLLCAESDEEQMLSHLREKQVSSQRVFDEVYGREVLLLRDPQNVPIRIVVTG